MLPIVLISKSKRSTTTAINKLLIEKGVPKTSVTAIEKEGATLKLENISLLQSITRYAYSKPRAVIIYDFETAKAEFQNALLKTLEEAQENVLFVLICSQESRLLETIKSRVKIIKLIHEKKTSETDLKLFFKNIFPKTDKLTKEKALQYLDALICELQLMMKNAVYAKNWHLAQKSCVMLRECISCRILLEINNLNPQMTIDHLAIDSTFLMG